MFAGKSLKGIRREYAACVLRGLGEVSTVDFGWAMWGDSCPSATRGTGSHCNNKFARSAGKLLKDLQAHGYAERTRDLRWKATPYAWTLDDPSEKRPRTP